MPTDFSGLRSQIFANAKLMLGAKDGQRAASNLPSSDTSATLVGGEPVNSSDIDIVIFSDNGKYTAAIMVRMTPAVEGPQCPTPEASLLKLLNATCELLNAHMPKLGSHQRNIYGGGVYDEDFISSELIEAQTRSS
ncbi:hypothetical protein HII31_04589 [Pseudocercospora fuligena]|uniref:Uncharacterized protein n=1 Tax=Pseudocercospora fuligena TaxID=685502 RepID=A0A8H6VIU7_9PEZI|nr:hypothetical protein HII31_04589 [Pseudocercospora fuligena]